MKKPFLFFFLIFSLHGFCQDITVKKLVCENAVNPLGIETVSPRLSWQMISGRRDVKQRAYRIIVADDSMLLKKNQGNTWDSKKVISSQSLQVKYAGRKLLPAKTYYWKLMVWDDKGSSAWSHISSWQMGLMDKKDWKGAKWIGYQLFPDSMLLVPAAHQKGPSHWSGFKNVLPLLRKNIELGKPVKKATAFICGLGHFEFSINAKKVGDHFLDPGWTQYDKEAQYVSFDITQNLQTGKNAMGVMLGNGFYFVPGERYRKLTGAFGYPKMIMRLLVEYSDGTSQDFTSDESWKVAESPIRFSSIYGGEDYNAGLEHAGWNTISFDDRDWKAAVVVSGPPVLNHQLNPPLKVHEEFSPKSQKKIIEHVYVFDLGQNASGIPWIQVQGKRGDTVRIVPAELLKEDGTVTQRATGSPVYFQYILKGDSIETWSPRFSYYGFRYLQVEGCRMNEDTGNRPLLMAVKGLHTRNASPQRGSFTSSNELFNRIFHLIDWSIKSNMASVLTDCPHREKLGWLEQTHLMGNSIHYNYDVASFFRKTIRDMQAAQSDSGHVPEYVPEYVKMPFMNGIFMDSPEWGSASIILPWYLYKWYGDKEVLVESYDMMKGYLQHMQQKSKGHILDYGLSDWYDLGPEKPGLAQLTPMGLTATAIYYYDLGIMQQVAILLGKKEEAGKYLKLAALVKQAFNKKFFDKQKVQYGSGSQTANAMALYMDLVPVQYRKIILEQIIKDIRSRNNSITAGDVGFRYLLQVLQQAGRSDVIFDMNNRTDVPGYGYQLAKGATALTESWQALPSVSINHLMLGHLMEWFYSGLGGIRQAPMSIAYKELIIDPQLVGDLHFAKTDFESPYGHTRSYWELKGDTFELEAEIPVNTKATIYLPEQPSDVILENKISIKGMQGIRFSGYVDEKAKLTVGSGRYHFTVVKKRK